jgi:hypothetical protein
MSQELEEWNEPKKELTIEEMDRYVKNLRELKDKYAEASAISKTLYAEVKEQEQKIIDNLKAAGKKRYILEGVGQISLTDGLSVQTPKTPEQKQAFFNWLREEMGEDGYLTYASVNSSSLNSLYKQKVEEYGERGEVLEIEGLEPPTSFTKLSLRKA